MRNSKLRPSLWWVERVFSLFIFLHVISLVSTAQTFDPNIYYRLIAKHSGLVLDVNLGQDEQANVVQHTWHGGDNQRWKIEPVGDGYYRLIAKHSGLVLDVNLGQGDQANVVQAGWHGGDNQRWKIEEVR